MISKRHHSARATRPPRPIKAALKRVHLIPARLLFRTIRTDTHHHRGFGNPLSFVPSPAQWISLETAGTRKPSRSCRYQGTTAVSVDEMLGGGTSGNNTPQSRGERYTLSKMGDGFCSETFSIEVKR